MATNEEVLSELKALAAAYPHTSVSVDTFKVFAQELTQYNAKAVADGCAAYRRDNRFFPSLSELVKMVSAMDRSRVTVDAPFNPADAERECYEDARTWFLENAGLQLPEWTPHLNTWSIMSTANKAIGADWVRDKIDISGWLVDRKKYDARCRIVDDYIFRKNKPKRGDINEIQGERTEREAELGGRFVGAKGDDSGSAEYPVG